MRADPTDLTWVDHPPMRMLNSPGSKEPLQGYAKTSFRNSQDASESTATRLTNCEFAPVLEHSVGPLDSA